MPRFFVEKCLEPTATALSLTGDDFHHIRDVLRMKPGDQLVVCDSARRDLTCRIDCYLPDRVVLIITAVQENQTEPPYQAILYQGLAKGEKMETIIQKAVELGAVRIVPVACQRSVVRLNARDQEKKLVRWNRIAAEAAKQCGRGRIPAVSEPLTFSQAVIEAAQADISLIPWENERGLGLREALEITVPSNVVPGTDPSISLLIGPEGGFAPEEIDAAVAAGIRPVSLGRRILRTETAGTVVLAMLVYRFNDF